jgi:hypothetical protein
MELNVACQSFFALLRAGLWNRPPQCDCFPLSPDAWKQVYMLARKQTVEGIIYDGIAQLPNHHFPPRDLLLKWVVAIDAIEERNKRMNKVIGELYELFTKNNITAFLMKGQGVAACYENPLHRICGDIDWSFPDKENFVRAYRLMEKKKANIERQAGFSACYVRRGFVVEHHRYLPDISNPLLSRYLRRIQKQENNHSAYLDMDAGKVMLVSPVLTHLSVNTHILKHLLAFGISIRQLCDSARVCYTYHGQNESESLKKVYKKLGIYPWIQMLNNLLVNYLGMPEDYLPFPLIPKQNADKMMKDILQGGSFGFYGGTISKETDEPQVQRRHVWLHLLIRFSRYARYAPYEACWFPVMHTYSHIKKWFVR